MSRTSTGKPVYRLAFGYPNIIVDRPDGQSVEVPLDSGDCDDRLRRLAEEIGTVGGQLVALLPESEVWRERGVPPSSVRAKAADALGSKPEELAVARYPAWPATPHGFAAVRRKTLVDARAFLDRFGLKPAAITAAGQFPGFGAPPSFNGLAAVGPAHRRAALTGVAATLALLVWIVPWRADTPVTVAAVETPVAQTAATAVPASPLVMTAAPSPAPAVELATLRPAARPADLAAVHSAPARVPVPPRAPAAEPKMALAARNLPAGLDARAPGRATAAPLAAIAPPARRPGAPAAATAERDPDAAHRPLPRPFASAQTAAPGPRGDGPYPRPPASRRAVADANLVASLGAAIAASDAPAPVRLSSADGPRARPATLLSAKPLAPTRNAPVLLASLGPAAALAAVAPPAPRRATAVQPAPVRAVAAPVRVQPQRAVAPQPTVRRAPQQPVAVVRAQPAPQPARLQTARAVQPAVQARQAAPQQARLQTARVQPTAPTRQAAPAQARRVQQAPVRAAATTPRQSRPEGSARGVALVGIFGNAEGRHALVQLSNGKTERVRAGDEIQGVQVTAVASDAVHLRGRGGDSVLKLPD